MSKEYIGDDGDREEKGSQLGFGRNVEDFLRSLEPTDEMNGGKKTSSGIFILSMASAGASKRKIRVLIENVSGKEELEFVLLEELCDGLCVGEIESCTMDAIEYNSTVTGAYEAACASFSYVQSSMSKLVQKLMIKGYPSDVAKRAVELFDSRGAVDEKKLAINRTKVFLDKHWGRSRIFSKLREEGFSDSALDAVRDELEEVDFPSICAKVIRRKFGSVPEEKREREKMFASLSRFGYSGTDIKEAIRIVNKDL